MHETVLQRRNGITRSAGRKQDCKMRRRFVRQLQVDEDTGILTPEHANRGEVPMDLVGERSPLAVDVIAHQSISSVADIDAGAGAI